MWALHAFVATGTEAATRGHQHRHQRPRDTHLAQSPLAGSGKVSARTPTTDASVDAKGDGKKWNTKLRFLISPVERLFWNRGDVQISIPSPSFWDRVGQAHRMV